MINSLLHVCEQIRNRTHKDITPLSGMDLYVERAAERARQGGVNTQVEEDATELLSYYVYDPSYLDRFLDYAQDPKNNIAKLTRREVLKIKTIIQYICNDVTTLYARRNPSPPTYICKADDCDRVTAFEKPYCSLHITQMPYAASLEEKVGDKLRGSKKRKPRPLSKSLRLRQLYDQHRIHRDEDMWG